MGTSYTMAAEVGRLSRNVRILSNAYPNLAAESFGPRVVVGISAGDTAMYIGEADAVRLHIALLNV